ncbi:unnamed protein product [Rotaria socialis]|uniref:C2H2-type domain-containing protein n=3 Tax=Rotaria TaxID=231623 RepID=A0A820P0P5_9BILA|nr:unnamed protein product [Rotaria socialis]CAF4463328.1 unnamed protein product [Rotaria socialis]CAF4807068.1 unnamed protein product [Rotaria socialis]
MSSQDYVCSLCIQAGSFPTFRKLFQHLQYVHNGQPNFKIRCELGTLCGTIYSTFNAYKTHIYREHLNLLDENLCRQPIQLDTEACDNISSSTCGVPYLDFDIQINDAEDEFQDEQTELDDDTSICWSLLKEARIQLSKQTIDLDAFERFYIELLLNLREGYSLPQNIIQGITFGFRSLIELIHELLKNQIKSSLIQYQRATKSPSTENVFALDDINKVILSVIHFCYDPAQEIKLDYPNQVAFYIPIQSSIQQLLSKPDVLNMLIKNYNETVNRNAVDTDLMYDYRHGSQAEENIILRDKPDSLLFQLYIDEIGLTNPIGAKKDTQKITMVYFQLEDLPNTVKSMLKSIGLIAMCNSNYLSTKSNKKKFFDPIVQDLNILQTRGLSIPNSASRLNFVFTVLTGDHLASNDIGGFQKSFSNGYFCRHCYMNYDERFTPLNEISHALRTTDEHDNLVKELLTLNNHTVLRGVVDDSPLSKLIGFHPVISLPNDIMHDINEGLCGKVLLAMLRETSTKRLLSYGEIEDRLISFKYGFNDKENKPPILRKKHLAKGKLIGTASQKMCLFTLFPIIFFDIIEQLDTREVYTCLREIVSLLYACPFRKSWLSYLYSLTIRFQCLMVHLLPNFLTSKVHLIIHYASQIGMFGPPVRHWCMRFEAKHQVFKRLAVKSNNYKNILYTLSKRHQLRQCLFFSSSNYYDINNEGYSSRTKQFLMLPADIRRLLQENIKNVDQHTLFMEYERLQFNHVMFVKNSVFVNNLIHEEEIPSFFHLIFIFQVDNVWLLVVEELNTVAFNESLWSYELEHTHLLSIKKPDELIRIVAKGLDIYEVNRKSYVNVLSQEDIDGDTLFNLPQSMMYEIIKPMKDRVRFLTEHRALFHGTSQNNSDQLLSNNYLEYSSENSSKQLMEQRTTDQAATASAITHSNNYQGDAFQSTSLPSPEVINEETIKSPKECQENDNNEDNEESIFPYVYTLPDLPLKIQQFIDKGEISHFGGHTNARRLLLDVIFTDVTTNYSLLYPNSNQYRSMAIATLKLFNIHNDTQALNDWIECLKSKFKRERRPLQQTSEQVQRMKLKHSSTYGRPIKGNDNIVAPRREVPIDFWNKIDLHDDPDDLNKSIQFMKNELSHEKVNFDEVRIAWKKTLVVRRQFIQTHTTKEVLQEYPGYHHVVLIFDEIQYLCNVDIESNLENALQKLLVMVPDNESYVNDLPTVRLIKLLTKHFQDSWQYLLRNKVSVKFLLKTKEPACPRPTIQITDDNFYIYLDFDMITQTKSINQALSVVISLYVIFELQFGTHNRVIHLLYGILLQESSILSKQLRLALKQWNFHIDKKERTGNIQLVKTISTTNNTQTTTIGVLKEIEGGHGNRSFDNSYQENSIRNIDDTQNSTTISTNPTAYINMEKCTTQTSRSSNLSSPIDPPLIIQIATPEKPEEEFLSEPITSEHTKRTLNNVESNSSKSNHLCTNNKKKSSSISRKRSASPEKPIAQRLKRSRNKTKTI